MTLNRTEAIDPDQVIRVIRVRPPGLHARRRRRAAALGRDQRCDRTHYCGAYWRWGFHEDGVWTRAARVRALRRAAAAARGMSASALYEGWVRHRRLAPGRSTRSATASS